jgi:transposase-like protein
VRGSHSTAQRLRIGQLGLADFDGLFRPVSGKALVQIANPARGRVVPGANHEMGVIRLKSVKELFSGRHFDREIIILCVRWYLRYKLSFRDLVEMMAERGLQLAHTTVMRWVQRYVPEFEQRWTRYMRQSGRSWRADETYLKVRGRWVYLYRAVDRDGNTVDFRLSPKRDVAAAKAFFRKALRTQGRAPISITLDGYAASHRAVREMPAENKAWKHSKLRSSKYLNNLIEAGSSRDQIPDQTHARLQEL